VSDITGSEMKEKESTHLPHQWRHWCFASCEHDRRLFTSKFRREIMAMSSTSPHQLDQGLFCQKTVAIYHYSPHVILIDSSTEMYVIGA